MQEVADGKIDRLMIFMPPGSGKSKYTTQLYAPWLMARRPRMKLIGSSHTSNLAEDFSGKIQRIVAENEATLGYGLRTEAKGLWYTTNDGAYLAAGVGGGIPGFRADGVIIDDPIRGRKSADSLLDRKTVWDWYNGDLERRLTPQSFIVLMHTRWHEDDLAGRLLETEGHRWVVLNLPAEAEENDALGRAPGEWLWADDDYGYGADLIEIKQTLYERGAAREWASQYQQRPRPPEGALFKVAFLQTVPAEPAGLRFVRAWDLAATADGGGANPDWTCGVKLGRSGAGNWFICDVQRFRGPPEEVERTILSVAKTDGASCTIGLPQDPGQAGKSQIAVMTRMLAGFVVESSPETGAKETRASPAAAQVNVGNVSIVSAKWNAAFREELASFPSGAKDDQVDAFSRAFNMLATAMAPARVQRRQY